MAIRVEDLRDYIITPTLKDLDMYSKAAVNLLLGTCAQESRLGRYLRQLGDGPALGIYQVEPETALWLLHDYLPRRPDISQRLQQASLLFSDKRIRWQNIERHAISHLLASNLRFSTALARLRYWVVTEPLPAHDDVMSLAKHYKTFYNSHQGAATITEYSINYHKYVGDAAL